MKNTDIDDRQDAKAAARKSAKSAPEADPDIAKRALEEAQGRERPGESHVNPVYKTQGDEHVHGENVHREKDAIISEFDHPSENTVKAKDP